VRTRPYPNPDRRPSPRRSRSRPLCAALPHTRARSIAAPRGDPDSVALRRPARGRRARARPWLCGRRGGAGARQGAAAGPARRRGGGRPALLARRPRRGVLHLRAPAPQPHGCARARAPACAVPGAPSARSPRSQPRDCPQDRPGTQARRPWRTLSRLSVQGLSALQQRGTLRHKGARRGGVQTRARARPQGSLRAATPRRASCGGWWWTCRRPRRRSPRRRPRAATSTPSSRRPWTGAPAPFCPSLGGRLAGQPCRRRPRAV
jgi:hypothetical protein